MKSLAFSKPVFGISSPVLAVLFAAGFLVIATAPQASGRVVLGPVVSNPVPVDAGELLLGELNCAACHKAEPSVAARLKSRTAPLLGEQGLPLTPAFLREWLTSPQKVKPGTTMPDLLQSVPEGERPEAVEALTHFLVSTTPSSGGAAAVDAMLMARGQKLFHKIGCVACHAPLTPPVGDSQVQAAVMPPQELMDGSVPLGPLAQKFTVDALTRFLLDPVKFHPSGRMPSLNLAEMDARSISMWLLRQQASSPGGGAPQKVAGLHYGYYEGDLPEDPKIEELKMVDSGSTATFSIATKRRSNNFLFRFEGVLTIKTAGNYRFSITSDDGARLFIGDKKIADTWGDHPMQEGRGNIDLQPGEHPISLIYYNRGAEGDLKVAWVPPGGKRGEIPTEVLSHFGAAMKPVGDAPFNVDAAKAAKGAALFSSLGCNACHALGKAPTAPPAAKDLAALRGASGCLAEAPSGKAARYALSAEQRGALRGILAKAAELNHPLDAGQQVVRTMAALNCYACHVRDGFGGPIEKRREYFSVVGEADMGDEGRIPPHLGKVGGKLKRAWLEEVLVKKGAVRPYNATRMPQFGPAVAGLPEALEKADWDGKAEPSLDGDIAREEKIGRKLAGTSGLTCVACHTFGPHKSLGIPAIDLTTMGKRLRYDWFRRYMPDPAALRPGTRMPSFWPGGVAANTEILGGDLDKQIHALWAYLAKGPSADVPAGLVVGRQEIIADKEPVIYRNFIQGAGSRAIGVGYPEKVSLAFDANELRLALIWQGSFIDASRHSTGRGEGYQPPLGDHVVQLPEGASFAILADEKTPWPADKGRNPAFQMKGYRFDANRRPTFLYTFKGVQVEDMPTPKGSDLDVSLERQIVLKSSQPPDGLYYRAAVSQKIEPKGEGMWKLEDGMVIKLRLPGDRKPIVRESAGKQELLVPVSFNSGSARFTQEFIW